MNAQVKLAVETVDARLKDLVAGTCIDVWIHGDDQVVESVLAIYRAKGIDIAYQYEISKELKSLLITAR